MTRKPVLAVTLDFGMGVGETQALVGVAVAVAEEAAESVARVFPILEFLDKISEIFDHNASCMINDTGSVSCRDGDRYRFRISSLDKANMNQRRKEKEKEFGEDLLLQNVVSCLFLLSILFYRKNGKWK
jgi:hypothetical protein